MFTGRPNLWLLKMVHARWQPNVQWHQQNNLDDSACGSTKMFHQNMFLKKRNGSTRSVSIWGLLWRNPKGFLILISFRGCTTHFCYDHFYIVDFHSAPISQVSVWKNLSTSKILLDSFKATPKYLQSRLSHFISTKQVLWNTLKGLEVPPIAGHCNLLC